MRDTRAEILSFWFLELEPAQWNESDPALDDEISRRFLLPYEMACNGLSDEWMQDPSGCLALILLLSEFPRFMFRGTPRVFATGAESLSVARYAIQQGHDQKLVPAQREFMYQPFARSEKLADHQRNIQLCEMLALDNPQALQSAKQNLEIIQNFGRFPQRNAILGRTNTPEEEKFLRSLL